MMVGLDFDDDAAHPIHQKGGADQFGRNLMHAPGKERGLEKPGFCHLRAPAGKGLVNGHVAL